MLVLSRRENQRIFLTLPDGRLVKIAVVGIRGDKVRLGIIAPKDVIVHREEVHEAILAQQTEQLLDGVQL